MLVVQCEDLVVPESVLGFHAGARVSRIFKVIWIEPGSASDKVCALSLHPTDFLKRNSGTDV